MGGLERVYVKYFDELPVVVWVNENMRPFTMHSLMRWDKSLQKSVLHPNQPVKLRKGALLFKTD